VSEAIVPNQPSFPQNSCSETEGATRISCPLDGAESPICAPIARAAAIHGLPIEFFTRLIRQESNFDPNSTSRAGAQGIAQFMPATARWRGLSDPFKPTQALLESARWLRELEEQFGNLGLAAAAYNAGPRRVREWIAGNRQLPNETQAYVKIVTGRTTEQWLSDGTHRSIADYVDRTAISPSKSAYPSDANRTSATWGLQLVGNSSESRALFEYAQLQKRYYSVLGNRAPIVVKKPMGGRGPSTWYFVRVAELSKERAMRLCSNLLSAGGNCIVSPN
jgi:hypothetical protein